MNCTEIVRTALEAAPKLIPIYGHGYIPADPMEAGNPVFSVHQTDIVYYGNDLACYFHREFGVALPEWAATAPRSIAFWSDAVGWHDNEDNYKQNSVSLRTAPSGRGSETLSAPTIRPV